MTMMDAMVGSVAIRLGIAIALAVGALFLAVLLIIYALNEKLRLASTMRWGRTGRGLRISRFGYLAWALNALGWAAAFAVDALNWKPPLIDDLIFAYLVIAAGVLIYAGCRDVEASRREKAN